MTKKQLIESIKHLPDDAEVVVEVHDTTLHEDLYDFMLDPIEWTKFSCDNKPQKDMCEIRICPIQNELSKEIDW
ncbi:MAG: hypothetical protein VXB01_03475 [Opitutae bacterium]